MSTENCTHDCSTCGENCASRQDPQDLRAPLAQGASVKHVYAARRAARTAFCPPWPKAACR